ncbi:hypothetical protein BHE74_00037937 [Ensete ventricosum]|nr:hypothetical protein BHE74_00037937 [Ensete ventricosum]
MIRSFPSFSICRCSSSPKYFPPHRRKKAYHFSPSSLWLIPPPMRRSSPPVPLEMAPPLLPFFLLVFFVAIGRLGQLAVRSEPVQDRAALLAFLDAIPHKQRIRWDGNSSACSWVGVTCDANRTAVVALRLPAVGLVGPIPSVVLRREPSSMRRAAAALQPVLPLSGAIANGGGEPGRVEEEIIEDVDRGDLGGGGRGVIAGPAAVPDMLGVAAEAAKGQAEGGDDGCGGG